MKLTRMLALVMALVMLISAPAMAGAKTHTVTFKHISIQENANDPTKMGLEVSFTGGGDEDRGYGAMTASGDGKQIVDAAISMENEMITLSMDGLTSNYTISKDDIEKMMEQGMGEDQNPDMPFDPEDIQELMEKYIEAIQQAKEQGKQTFTDEELAAFYTDAGFVAGAEETVTVNGVEMTLPRYDLDMDAQGLDKMISASFARVPAMKEFMEAYVEFLEKVSADSLETVHFDDEHLFSSLFEQTGTDIRVKAALWTDAKGDNLRMEMEETVTEKLPDSPAAEAEATEPREPVTVVVPMTMQVNTDERGMHMTMDMDMDQQGVAMKMLFKLNDALLNEGAKGNFLFDMTVEDQAINLTGDYGYDAAGKGVLNCELNVPVGENATSRNSFQVTSTGGDVNTHSVQLRTMQMQKEGAITKELSRLTVGFDMVTAEGELPQGALIDNGKPSVDILTMTKEQQDKAMEELMTKGIMAYGQLMATEGVAKLLTDMVMMAQRAYEAYSQSPVAAA